MTFPNPSKIKKKNQTDCRAKILFHNLSLTYKGFICLNTQNHHDRIIMMFCHVIFFETMSNTEGPAEN